LTDRDGWSATFEHALSLKEPRTDCPLHTPDAPLPVGPFAAAAGAAAAAAAAGAGFEQSFEALLPLNDLQENIASVLNFLSHGSVEGVPTHLERQGQLGEWYSPALDKHLARSREWRASKQAGAAPTVVCQPRTAYHGEGKDDQYWDLVGLHASVSWQAVATKNLRTNGSLPLPFCLDADEKSAGALTVSACLHSHPSQKWQLHSDGTLRPFKNPSMCATCNGDSGDLLGSAVLAACDGRIGQHFASHFKNPGDSGGGIFEFGDDTNALGVVQM
jgi:hypothetical protein